MRKPKTKILSTAIIALVFFLAGLHVAQAYVVNGNSWIGSKPRVPVFVSTNLDGHIPYDGFFSDAIDDVILAIEEWNIEGNSEFQFFYAGTTSIATTADDGYNVIYFVDDQCSDSTCGAMVVYHENTTDIMHGFDIELYAQEGTTGFDIFWATKETLLPWDTDIWGTVAHELGHALGLGHSDLAGAVMSTSCGTGCSGNRILTLDDIDGVQSIYGAFTNRGIMASVTNPAPGDSFDIDLDFGTDAASKPYLIYMAANAGNPGLMFMLWDDQSDTYVDSRILPLFPYSGGGAYIFFPTFRFPTVFQNFFGLLDVDGKATATINWPAIPLVFNLYFGAIIIDQTEMSNIRDVTLAELVTITPAGP